MKANEFFKKVGIEAVRSYVAAYEDALTGDLKRLVESHELVEKYKDRHGGIRFRIRWGQFRYGDTKEYNDRLKQAVADVESCMEVSSESN